MVGEFGAAVCMMKRRSYRHDWCRPGLQYL